MISRQTKRETKEREKNISTKYFHHSSFRLSSKDNFELNSSVKSRELFLKIETHLGPVLQSPTRISNPKTQPRRHHECVKTNALKIDSAMPRDAAIISCSSLLFVQLYHIEWISVGIHGKEKSSLSMAKARARYARRFCLWDIDPLLGRSNLNAGLIA